MSLSSIRLCANISVLPPVAQNSLVEYLNLSDIFVLPSYSEVLSNSLMEAMAVGLPVVATKVGDNTKLVKNGYTGLLIEPKSVEQIIVSLRTLF
jgi:glycosyltransferase involved in cell wall biosynthesis